MHVIKYGSCCGATPSLRAQSDDLLGDAWTVGRNNALAKLDLDDDMIPEAPFFTFAQAFDDKFELETLSQPES
jgi:Domain of unknown function DUF29